MTGRKRELKADPNGSYRPYLGFYIRDGKRTDKRWNLGKDRNEAERRFARLMLLYDECQSRPDASEGIWSVRDLEVAAALEKGATSYTLPFPTRQIFESEKIEFARGVTLTQREYPSVPIIPGNRSLAAESTKLNQEMIRQKIAELQAELDRMGALEKGQEVRQLSGLSLRQALAKFDSHIRTLDRYRTPEGNPNTTGKTVLDQIKSLSFYFETWLDMDMGTIGRNECEAMIRKLADRPKTQRGKSLKQVAAKHLIWTTRKFLEWADKTNEIVWDLPAKFSLSGRIQYRQPDLDELDAQRSEIVTIPTEHLKRLVQNANQNERLIIGLALNAAYGSDQIGRLQCQWFDDEKQIMDGSRLKKSTASKHHIWKCNVGGLVGRIGRRTKGEIFLTDSGLKMYRPSKAGNQIDEIGRAFESLVGRIRKADENFPNYSFGKLRKTAATMTLAIADPSIASMLLAHKNVSDDKLLKAYAALPWEKLFETQRQLEKTLVSEIGLDAEPVDILNDDPNETKTGPNQPRIGHRRRSIR